MRNTSHLLYLYNPQAGSGSVTASLLATGDGGGIELQCSHAYDDISVGDQAHWNTFSSRLLMKPAHQLSRLQHCSGSVADDHFPNADFSDWHIVPPAQSQSGRSQESGLSVLEIPAWPNCRPSGNSTFAYLLRQSFTTFGYLDHIPPNWHLTIFRRGKWTSSPTRIRLAPTSCSTCCITAQTCGGQWVRQRRQPECSPKTPQAIPVGFRTKR